jgi:hypothetical protein
MPKQAMLHPAFVWDCDECGTENFVRTVRADLSAEELAEMKEDYDVEPWEEGEFLTAPKHVSCKQCGHEFETEHD